MNICTYIPDPARHCTTHRKYPNPHRHPRIFRKKAIKLVEATYKVGKP